MRGEQVAVSVRVKVDVEDFFDCVELFDAGDFPAVRMGAIWDYCDADMQEEEV
jgi:hypothetical protein